MNTNEAVVAPVTIREVKGILSKIGYPNHFPVEVFHLISQKEGTQFTNAIVDIANNDPSADFKRDYVEAIIAAISPNTVNTLAKLGYSLALSDVIELSKQEGRSFRSAVLHASNPQNEVSEPAKTYLERLLASSVGSGIWDFPIATPAASAESRPMSRPASAEAPVSEPSHKGPQQCPASGPRPAPRPVAPPAQSARPQQFESYKIYGGSAAICFGLDSTQSDAKPTVRVEVARLISPRSYDWSNKVGFQLRVAELPLVYGVLTGLLPELELRGHGQTNEKALLIKDQGDSFFFSLRIRGQDAYSLPAQPAEVFLPMSMLWRQLQANTPGVEPSVLNEMIQSVCRKQAAKANK